MQQIQKWTSEGLHHSETKPHPPKWGKITLLNTFGSKEEIKPAWSEMWTLDTEASRRGPGHQALSRGVMTWSPHRSAAAQGGLGGGNTAGPPRDGTWADVLCREVCGIQGRAAWGLHKSQHSCRRTSAEQLTWGHISTNLLPNGGNQEEGVRRSSGPRALNEPVSQHRDPDGADWSSCLSWPWELARRQKGVKRESQQHY